MQQEESAMYPTLMPLEDSSSLHLLADPADMDVTLTLEPFNLDWLDLDAPFELFPLDIPPAPLVSLPASEQQRHPSLSCSLLPAACELMLLDLSNRPRLLDCSPNVRARLLATEPWTVNPTRLFQQMLRLCLDQPLMQTVRTLLLRVKLKQHPSTDACSLLRA